MNLTDQEAKEFMHLLGNFIDASIDIKIADTQDLGESGAWYLDTNEEKEALHNFLTGKT